MYFPYLRGRQYEMLALRELIEKGKISDEIIPIIEPLKFSSTYLSAIKMFTKEKRKISIIMNPLVGDFYDELLGSNEDKIKEYKKLLESEYVIPAYWMKNNITEITLSKNVIYICNDRDDLANLNKYNENKKPLFTLIPYDRLLRKSSFNKVLFEDAFVRKERNADYASNPDEFFSDNHISYQEDDFIGFSDYSVIGDEYKESGFAPMAVAIHFVYFKNDFSLRIKHFVSDSNYDINDPAGKFKEALTKLCLFINSEEYQKYNELTIGAREFLECMKNAKYPGLGTVKKISIMHHIECIYNFMGKKK